MDIPVFEGAIRDDQKPRVLVVHNIPSGGLVKYVNDIKYLFYHKNFVQIRSKMELEKAKPNSKDIMFIQHLLETGT